MSRLLRGWAGPPVAALGVGGPQSRYSLSFAAASSQYVDAGNAGGLNPTAAITLACWVKRTAAAGNNGDWYITRDDNTLGRSYAMGVDSGNNLRFQINGGNSISTTTVLPLNEWHHLCVTGSPAAGYVCYLDGVSKGTANWTAPGVTTGHTNLGRRSYVSFEGYVSALLDDCLVHPSDLTANVAALAAGTLNPATLDFSGGGGLWRFEEGTGTTTADSSGNGNTGTLVNGVTWSTDVPTQLQ